MIIRSTLLTLLMILFFLSCKPQADHTHNFPYDLKHPQKTFELPNSLIEISGITFYNDYRLACVQDEKGKIYIYNLRKEDVKEGVDFGADRDYEGIAFVDDTFYVLNSSGTLYAVSGFGTSMQKTKKYETFLKKSNNTEGLCYDKSSNSLLIACKGNSLEKGVKEIYRFSLSTGTIAQTPAFTINLKDLKKFLAVNKVTAASNGNDDFFEPSEIAIHPSTGEIYVLSSTAKLIVVMNRNGTIKEASSIDPSIAAHPEGMTFSTEGSLFISSEGKGKKKVILEYAPAK